MDNTTQTCTAEHIKKIFNHTEDAQGFLNTLQMNDPNEIINEIHQWFDYWSSKQDNPTSQGNIRLQLNDSTIAELKSANTPGEVYDTLLAAFGVGHHQVEHIGWD